jgi:hypothetical protein
MFSCCRGNVPNPTLFLYRGEQLRHTVRTDHSLPRVKRTTLRPVLKGFYNY